MAIAVLGDFRWGFFGKLGHHFCRIFFSLENEGEIWGMELGICIWRALGGLNCGSVCNGRKDRFGTEAIFLFK